MDSEGSEPLDFAQSTADFAALEKGFEEYTELNKSLRAAQDKCQSSLKKQKGHLKDWTKELARQFKAGAITESDYKEKLAIMQTRKTTIDHIAVALPIPTHFLLAFVLGSVNVTLLHMGDRFRYKNEYEVFKRNATCTIILLALLSLYFECRLMDTLFHTFLAVYYAILTVRELILIANGSRIKLWWRLHHYISIIQSFVILEWPDGESYEFFRNTFLYFSLYLGVVQLLQFQYQKDQLYKKRSLGQGDIMETTTELPNKSTFTVLILALFAAYIFQLHNASILYSFIQGSSSSVEYNVYISSLSFALLGIGNLFTTLMVLRSKFLPKKKLE